MKILSIQSWVSYGHVGNAAAVFPLQRLGAEVWAIHTVQFSNHTGYGDWKGHTFMGQDILDLLAGIGERGALSQVDAFLSGYLGDISIAQALRKGIGDVKIANSKALYCCDPVMENARSGCFVKPDIPPFIRSFLAPMADILTPNQFEIQQMVGMACSSTLDIIKAIKALQLNMSKTGPRVVLITNSQLDTTPKDSIDMFASIPGEIYQTRIPRLPFSVNGSGDLIAAVFLYHFLNTGHIKPALENAASSVWNILDYTYRCDSRELLIVQAQDQLITPTRCYVANKLDV